VAERRKLIEVALPLEAINREAAREKSIRHGHPSTLHLWWARRPLAAARAVLFAQLVDDPDSGPEAEAIVDPGKRAAWVSSERVRLFRLLEELVKWENSADERILGQARAEILRSTNGNPPPILDPFAGGGTIPLEAQRLGLEARASDLNPVAVLINMALMDIPHRFAGQAPVFPGAAINRLHDTWPRATGLADDVRRYGEWMREQAAGRIGYLYPKATLPDGNESPVLAWIWARTVTCPNPACGIQMPLVRSWWLAKKTGKEAYVDPKVVDGEVRFEIIHGSTKASPTKDDDGTVTRTGATCIGCKSAVDLKYVRSEGRSGRLNVQLMAVVAEGSRQRVYLSPTLEHRRAAQVDAPTNKPSGQIPPQAPSFRVQAYGFREYTDLFSSRQLIALTTLSDLVGEARDHALVDATMAGLPKGDRLADGGVGAAAYADSIATYLGLACSRLADYGSTLSTWMPDPKNEGIRNTFARQALPMTWDFAEANPFSTASGNFTFMLRGIGRVLDELLCVGAPVIAQADAASANLTDALISTDPPYYDNIGYSDLSDFFYIWLRRSLRSIHPVLLNTLLVPKADELVANPYRHHGRAGAQQFFESGFREVFARARIAAGNDFPITVYYAFKQASNVEGGESSTGWETLLDGMVRGGWRITGTWPMRSERAGRMISVGTNALASSVVLALRPRPSNASVIDRRSFVAELRDSLPDKLRELQQGSIAAVDLPQAAIGPGMAVFSQHAKVMEANGSAMTVRSALQVINQILGEVLWQQEGDFDPGTRWCVKWFELHGFEPGAFGDANNLASAYNASVEVLAESGVLKSGGSQVQLIPPRDLPLGYDPRANDHVTLWEIVLRLSKALDERGLNDAGLLMSRASTRIDLDAAKEVAYLLYAVSERNRWSAVAQLFNTLAASWSDVVEAGRRNVEDDEQQLRLDVTY
jgi:putative DNA methylase